MVARVLLQPAAPIREYRGSPNFKGDRFTPVSVSGPKPHLVQSRTGVSSYSALAGSAERFARLELLRKPRRLRNRRAEGGRDDHGSVVGGNCLSPFTQIVRPRLENLGGVSPTRAEPRIGVKTTSELLEGIT